MAAEGSKKLVRWGYVAPKLSGASHLINGVGALFYLTQQPTKHKTQDDEQPHGLGYTTHTANSVEKAPRRSAIVFLDKNGEKRLLRSK